MSATPMRASVILTLGILGLGVTTAADGQDAEVLFPSAEPEAVGMSAERLAAAVDTVHRWVQEEEIAGAVLLVVRRGKTVLHEAFGMADREAWVPMRTDMVFLTASMTKPMTGTAVLQLYERGLLDLQDRVADHVREFATPETSDITIYQLLTHTGGLPAWNSGLEGTSHLTLVRAIAEAGTQHDPGAAFHYSDRGSTVLGYLVERVSGRPLMDYLQEEVLAPLQMTDSYVSTGADDPRLSRVPPRYQLVDGELQRWQTSKGVDRDFLGGSGGLFSTTTDYARFMKAFQEWGRLGDVQLLKAETVRQATRKHEPRPEGMYDYGLHWGVGLRGLSCEGISHGGSRGTIAFFDRDHDLMVLYFTQTRRTPTRTTLVQLIHDAIEP